MELKAKDIKRAINLALAAALMRGRGGRGASLGAVRKWADPKRGYAPMGHQGEPLVLKTVRLGRDVVTLPEWVDEFEERRFSMQQTGGGSPAPVVRPARSRNAAHRRAEEALDAAGVGGSNG